MGNSTTKFLIIRFSSIGDIILTTPLVRCLKKQYPGAEVHYVVKKKFAMVVESNPYIDKIHYLEDRLGQLTKTLKEEQFDYIIDLHKTLRSYLLRLRLKRKTLSFRKLSVQKFLLTKLGINLLPPQTHIVERIMETVAPLGVKNDDQTLDYFLTPDERYDTGLLPEKFRKGYLAFVIGGQHFTKRLPLEKITSICSKIDFPIVLLGGPEDKAAGTYLEKQLKEKVYNLCGQLPFNQSASVLKQAQLVITHDTGLMHVASAFNKPVISIWGATAPYLYGLWPYRNSERYEAIVPDLPCHPCTNFGSAKCPRGHFACMRKQDESAIVNEASRMIQLAAQRPAKP